MSNGEADTWDPDLYGVEADGHEPAHAPSPAVPAQQAPSNHAVNAQAPNGAPRPHQAQWAPAMPMGQRSWQGQQAPISQHPQRPIQNPPAPGMHSVSQSQHGWGAQQGYGQAVQTRRPNTGQGPISPQAAPPQSSARRPYEHYRDGGVLPWWAWAGIGAVVIACGLLAVAVLSPSTLDPDRSAGFDPRLHEDYADMALIQAGGTFRGEVDSVPWEVRVSDTNWDAGEQASIQTSLPEASSGKKYVGIELDLASDRRSTTPVDEALLFYYLTPGGQEYTEHYCGYGCLSDTGSFDYTSAGWIYFEVPQSVPEGGHLRINLLYSGESDALMELL